MLMKHGIVGVRMMGGEFNVTMRLVLVSSRRRNHSSILGQARYLLAHTEKVAYVVLVELVTKRLQDSTTQLINCWWVGVRNDCCLEDVVYRKLHSAAFLCIRPPMSQTPTLLGAYAIDQLLMRVINNCCLQDVVYRLLRAAAFLCIRPPMSRVLFQIQDCITPISYLLPEDVIIDILLMLPVKTLLRFKAVCKTWKKIITSSYFEHQHFGREGNHTHLLVCWRGISAIPQQHAEDDYHDDLFERADSVSLFPNGALETPPLELGKGLFTGVVSAVCGPCNGILCVRFSYDISYDTFALWNPATRKLWSIPECPLQTVWLPDMFFSFWIDLLTNEFKIFWIEEGGPCNGEMHHFITYTSSNDSWKELEAPIYPGDYVMPCQYGYPVSNGFYYFVKLIKTTHYAIIAYDICKDLFQEIRMPKIEINLKRQINLDLFGDSLALFAFENENVEARAEIWVMKEIGYWTKLFNVDIPVDKPGHYQPLGFWKRNEVFIYCFTYDRPRMCELMIYNTVSGKSRKVLTETREGVFQADFFPLCYKESLMSIKIKDTKVDSL